jgi:hypothetical protein
MPHVIHSFRGTDRSPRLKIPKGERAILENAAGLCAAISNATAGHNPEFAEGAAQLAVKLQRYVEIVEPLDLTQPF